MSFFEQVHHEAQPIWDRVLEHPFIRGLADGTLPEETFRYYVGQDTKYLVQYARARAAGIVKASDPATMLVFAEGVNYVLAGETSFPGIAALVETTLQAADGNGIREAPGSIDHALEIDQEARQIARDLLRSGGAGAH